MLNVSFLNVLFVLIGIVGMQEGFSQCVQNEDSSSPCLDQTLVYSYEHVSQEPEDVGP